MPRRLYGCDMERTVAYDVLEEAFQTFLRKFDKPKLPKMEWFVTFSKPELEKFLRAFWPLLALV